MNFCNQCGEKVVFRTPEGDNRNRFLCEGCGTIHYQNPRVITGCLAVWKDQVMLCKRSIQPRSGFWTLPAGFLENGETATAGAERETWEEARAKVGIIDLYTMFSLPHISQIYLFYRAHLIDGVFAPGEETEAVELFHEADIPWNKLAFPVIRDTLKHYFHDRQDNLFKVHTGDIVISHG